MITNRKGERWIIPKGLVEDDLTALESAAREAWEEAGVKGRISEKSVGEYRYEKWGGTCIVEVFLLNVTDVLAHWPEDDFRQREWVGVEEAAGRVREEALRKIIRQAPKLVKKAKWDNSR
jgi:8-oxo-dGTP pyrophosphatase MutT (NUDIX family)